MLTDYPYHIFRLKPRLIRRILPGESRLIFDIFDDVYPSLTDSHWLPSALESVDSNLDVLVVLSPIWDINDVWHQVRRVSFLRLFFSLWYRNFDSYLLSRWLYIRIVSGRTVPQFIALIPSYGCVLVILDVPFPTQSLSCHLTFNQGAINSTFHREDWIVLRISVLFVYPSALMQWSSTIVSVTLWLVQCWKTRLTRFQSGISINTLHAHPFSSFNTSQSLASISQYVLSYCRFRHPLLRSSYSSPP